MDLGSKYRASRLRIAQLVDDEVATRQVPATEKWNVHDVVAHVAGIAEDAANDNMAGAPSDEWTAAQVARAAQTPVGLLLVQWAGHAAPMEAFLSTPAGEDASAAVVDVHSHEADLRHALGLPAEPDEEFLEWAAAELLAAFHRSVAEQELPAVTVRAEPFEIWRGRLGRRTPEEIAALDWSADPRPYLDTWFVFGRRDAPLHERRR